LLGNVREFFFLAELEVDKTPIGVKFFLRKVSISFSEMIRMGNLGMEKRPLRFSLPEAFLEGSKLKAKGVGEEVRGRLSGHGFSTERREERRRMRSEFPRWGNERADESHTRALAEFRSAEKGVSGTALRT
jgi:hypothetical protein